METEAVLISDMSVECSLQLINFNRGGIAMSDCCRRHATSGVVSNDGRSTWWRCRTHEGMLDFRTGDKGEIVFVIDRKVNDEG